MSPGNELLHQFLSLKDHIHASHIEEYFEKWRLVGEPMPCSSRQAAIFNQCLLEFFELDLTENIYPKEKGSDLSWDFTYLALLPSDVLNKTLTLWSACIHAQKLDKYIAKEDIQKIKKLFSDSYHWLSCSSLTHPNHPKERLQPSSFRRAPVLDSPKLPVESFLGDYLLDTAFWGAYSLSQHWPSTLRRLLLLKLPRLDMDTRSQPPGLESINKKELESTLISCLERVSKKWHEKFLAS